MISRRGLLKGLIGLGASAVSFGAYAIGIEPMLRLEIARYQLTPPGWPPDFRLRIVVLSDFHACDPWTPLSRIRRLVETANNLNGDVILMLGDYVSGKRLPHWPVDPGALAAILAGLKAPLGSHAILGNHDWWVDDEAMQNRHGPTFMHRALAAANINHLENDAIRLVHAGRSFWLAGLGDQIAFQLVPRRLRPGGMIGVDDLPATLAKITDDAPAILMAHEPDIIVRVPARIALTLSGHTHGGQVNIFGWRPAAASRLSERFPRGHFRENGRDLLVSSGLGCSIAPIRVGVPPEIMVVELGGAPAT
jgi:predicted MPP superfamily phosphohydrolase